MILEAKDESAVANRAWFEKRWRLVQDALTQLEARLRAFYTQHNGAKLAFVGQIAREHVGNEKALNQKLRAAYQTDLGLGAGGSAGVQVLQMAPPDCQLCEDTVATLFCKQCQENFCQEVACSLPLQACSSCVHQLPLRSPLPAIIICVQHPDALFLRSASMRSTILESARGTKFCRWRRAPRAALKSRKQQ